MHPSHLRRLCCLVLVACISGIAGVAASEEPGIGVIPPKATLRGPDSVQQLAVENLQNHGDVTAAAIFASSDEAVATVDAAGTVTAKGDGKASIRVTAAGRTEVVPVEVKDFAGTTPTNFSNQVVPIFTKLGCNSGGCHGKATGQNGFKLSLFGFDPPLDYETLVKEGRGRRLFPANPERSLLLQKAVAEVPHGGGRKMERGSHEYRVIARWIGAGMPFGKSTDPVVAKVEIYPDARVMSAGQTQQVIVTAHYTDGATEDVTRWAQYQSNDVDVAEVAQGGVARAREMSGQAAIMARYQGNVAVFRATVPLRKGAVVAAEFDSSNPIDAATRNQWQALGVTPSGPCSDSEFIRRASLDITGALPKAAEIKEFTADTDPEKRRALVDRLLASPEYASFFALKWADVLRNKREGNPLYQRGSFSFHDWIRESLDTNVPYDKFVRSILSATGTPETAPPVQWFRRLRQADAFVDDSAQVFLGMRLQCAKCHHHPFEKWSQDDYYGFAAFFAKIGRKPFGLPPAPGVAPAEEVIFNARQGAVTHPKTGKVMVPRGLGGPELKLAATADPRKNLVDWMTNPDNPFFARALVNRYWSHFFGRGIVEPMDDLRLTNPPSNPELLDALSSRFKESGYDLKALVRLICTSRTYALSSIPNEFNAKDKQSFARHYPRRMTAEVLLDAISELTGVATPFGGMPAGTRAVELPDESIASTFLDVFGRPKRDTSCECERVTDASLGQSLMLLNSGEVQSKLAAAGGRAIALAADPRPDVVKVDELFWAAFGRAPTTGESAGATSYLESHATKRGEAFEDILWALVNSKEFQFND
ncbi:DUF1553 domain-containing protein [Isosphaeraceae bacterium EP7]